MKKVALRRVSKKPHRIEKRFVSAKTLKELEERSRGMCEVVFRIITGSGGKDSRCHPDCKMLTQEALNVISLGYRCQSGAMRQPHHILKRSRGGKHTPDNLLKVCFECHRWIEDNESEAVKYGLSKRY